MENSDTDQDDNWVYNQDENSDGSSEEDGDGDGDGTASEDDEVLSLPPPKRRMTEEHRINVSCEEDREAQELFQIDSVHGALLGKENYDDAEVLKRQHVSAAIEAVRIGINIGITKVATELDTLCMTESGNIISSCQLPSGDVIDMTKPYAWAMDPAFRYSLLYWAQQEEMPVSTDLFVFEMIARFLRNVEKVEDTCRKNLCLEAVQAHALSEQCVDVFEV